MQTHPFLSETFHIPWSSLTAEHIVSDIKHALELAEQRLSVIRQADLSSLSYESSFAALESAAVELERGWGEVEPSRFCE